MRPAQLVSGLRTPFGRALRRRELSEQVLGKRYALPIFASDALSSVAYASEEILKVLALAGVAYFAEATWLAAIIVLMLAVLTISYRQTIYAYPSGGGAYIVARDNLGEAPAQLAGAALLVDYILTVSVSLASGVANLASGLHQFLPAVPEVGDTGRVIGCLFALGVMWFVNKRGIKESGRAFALPTYFFITSVFVMLIAGLYQWAMGTIRPVADVSDVIQPTQLMTTFLLLRAFASGSTAVTGVEAISNGVTAFEEPKSRNAALTMAWMCALLGVMFLGITRLALLTQAQASESETVISQIGRTVFGAHSPFYVALIFGTAAILVMAANTSFADFPRLAALHAADGFLPRWMLDRDNRLVFGFGITVLSLASGLLLVVFNADVTHLIPLYAIGVFLSFTLSQAGMVVRWRKAARLRPGEFSEHFSPEGQLVTVLRHDARWRVKLAVNALGAAMTGVVMVVFAVAKFTEGAWVVIILVPALLLLFFRIHAHYRRVARGLAVTPEQAIAYLARPVSRMRLLLIGSMGRHDLPALREFVRTGTESTRRALHVDVNPVATAHLQEFWTTLGLREAGIPLLVIPNEFGKDDVIGAVVGFVNGALEANPGTQVEVVFADWAASTGALGWLTTPFLHHLTGLRLRLAFLADSRVTVTNYRFVLGTGDPDG